MPMTDEQIKAPMQRVKPLHFPTVLGAVVLTYNIPGVTGDLKLTPEVIAGIYLGDSHKWNDAKIASANPGVKLPAKAHRSRAPLRRQRHDIHLHRLSFEGQPGVEDEGRRQRFGAAGRSVWAAKATTAWPVS